MGHSLSSDDGTKTKKKARCNIGQKKDRLDRPKRVAQSVFCFQVIFVEHDLAFRKILATKTVSLNSMC